MLPKRCAKAPRLPGVENHGGMMLLSQCDFRFSFINFIFVIAIEMKFRIQTFHATNIKYQEMVMLWSKALRRSRGSRWVHVKSIPFFTDSKYLAFIVSTNLSYGSITLGPTSDIQHYRVCLFILEYFMNAELTCRLKILIELMSFKLIDRGLA